jgi:putative toxin-antitoxin system antitoxin component (TIGR02293 family)
MWAPGRPRRPVIATTIAPEDRSGRRARSGGPASGATVQKAAERITYDRVRSGLNTADVTALISQGVLAKEEVQRVIPPRTLARRKARGEPLTVDESDRIARLVRVVAQAARVFEDPELRSAWLRTGNPALGGERPIDLAVTDMGARRVETVLNRIAWGDYS